MNKWLFTSLNFKKEEKDMWKIISLLALIVIVMAVVLKLIALDKVGHGHGMQPPSPLSLREANSAAGVVLHDCISENNSEHLIMSPRLENTNEYEVLIRKVFTSTTYIAGIGWRDTGEITEWMKSLEPGIKLELVQLSTKDRFYIYNVEGGLLGFMSGICE